MARIPDAFIDDLLARSDIVEVVGSPGPGEPEVRHIENAFQMPREFRLPW